MKRFPQTICVKIEPDDSGPDYLVAATEFDELVEMGEKIKVGVYKLVETKIVQGVVKVGKGKE